MRTFLRWLLILLAILLFGAALSVWLIVREPVAKLRASSKAAAPVAPQVRSALLAQRGESNFAYLLVRTPLRPRRMLPWHIENAVKTYVVARLFTPEDLLRIYAHELYLGKQVTGVEQASRFYFGKDSHNLTIAEAATIAAIAAQPHYYSPVTHPDRALDRRNGVLKRMMNWHFIDERQYQAAIAEPLTLR